MAAPAAVGERPRTDCTQSGTYVTIASIAAPTSAPVTDETAMNPLAEEVEREERLRRAPLDPQEGPEEDGGGRQGDEPARARGRREEGDDGGGEQRRAGEVEAVGVALGRS